VWVSAFDNLSGWGDSGKDTAKGSGVRRGESGCKAAVSEIGVCETETKGEAWGDVGADECFVVDVYALGKVA